MRTDKIYDDSGKRFIRVFSTGNVEKVNPIEYFRSYEIEKRSIVLRDMLEAKEPLLSALLDDEFFMKKAVETLEGFFEKFEATEIHDNWIKLLSTSRKKDQVALLRGMSLNPDQLYALTMKAYSIYGYLYSMYRFEILPNGLGGRKLPRLFWHKDDDSIEIFGDTDLKEGELKNVSNHRTVIVSHFFEREEIWHCIFVTYDSLKGKEGWKDGQPHFHYISSGFGISKEEFVDSMKTGKYRSTNVHIDLLEYGVQPGK